MQRRVLRPAEADDGAAGSAARRAECRGRALRDEARCDAFTTHFEAVLSGAGGSVSAAVRADFARKATNATVAPDAPVPTEADVLAAVAAQKAGRAADQYGLNATLLHALATPGSAVASILTRLVADVWESGEMPQERCRALLIALYKNKGDPQATTNYRGVVLVQFLWRIVMRLVLMPSVIPGIEARLPENQCGSRPQRGCVDQLFTLRLLQEQAFAKRVPLYAAFIDLAKAFDSIDRLLLFDMMTACGFPANVLRIFKSMYSRTACAVRCGRVVGDAFDTRIGVQQGCISGSWCFNLFLFFVFEPIMEELSALGVELRLFDKGGKDLDHHALFKLIAKGKHDQVFRLGALFIVDDTTLLSDSLDGLRAGLARSRLQAAHYGLRPAGQRAEERRPMPRRGLVRAVPPLRQAGRRGQVLDRLRQVRARGTPPRRRGLRWPGC